MTTFRPDVEILDSRGETVRLAAVVDELADAVERMTDEELVAVLDGRPLRTLTLNVRGIRVCTKRHTTAASHTGVAVELDAGGGPDE